MQDEASASAADAAAGGPSDEDVSQFLAFTGSADPSNAVSYLEMSGGDLERAVGLYMEHQGGGGMGGGAASASATGTGTSIPDANNNNLIGSPEVRAPDATRTMRLMDGPPMHHHPMMGMLQDIQQEMSMSSAFAAAGDARAAVNAAASMEEQKSNDSDEDDYVYDDDDDDDVQVVAPPPAPPTLADMFAPPSHLLHSAGGFQGARAVARDSRRWLLVNLQRDSEFSSHALNRDVWRDELVENLVREGFIFWQQLDSNQDGQTYAQRYSVMEYPHIAIIDPRTGRLMFRKEGWTQENPLTAEAFAEMAMDFCSRHSFDKPPEAPRMPSSSNGATASAAAAIAAEPASRPSANRPFLTEEEQLQAAMRASLQKDDEVEPMDDDDDDDVQVVEKQEEATPSLVQELVDMEVGDEPAEGGARIQLRMPDGKRLVRTFTKSNSVKHIYAFVAQSNDEAKGGKEFILRSGYPPRDLMLNINDTIESCNLAGEQIVVRWK